VGWEILEWRFRFSSISSLGKINFDGALSIAIFDARVDDDKSPTEMVMILHRCQLGVDQPFRTTIQKGSHPFLTADQCDSKIRSGYKQISLGILSHYCLMLQMELHMLWKHPGLMLTPSSISKLQGEINSEKTKPRIWILFSAETSH